MPTYSQIEPEITGRNAHAKPTWEVERDEEDDALMDCDVNFTLVSELDALEEEGY